MGTWRLSRVHREFRVARRLTSIVIGIEARDGAARDSAWDEPAPRLAGARLSRFRQLAQAASGDDLLLVIAGCIHLSMAVTIDLQQARDRLVLCIDPQRQVFQCTARLHSLSSDELARLKLLQVATRIGADEPVRVGTRDSEAPALPLAPLLWTLAMHGSRSDLLPGVSESARYAIAPQWSRTGIPIDRTLLPVLDSMRLFPWTLPQLAARPELGGLRARRLLNALQLLRALETRVSGPSASRHSSGHERKHPHESHQGMRTRAATESADRSQRGEHDVPSHPGASR